MNNKLKYKIHFLFTNNQTMSLLILFFPPLSKCLGMQLKPDLQPTGTQCDLIRSKWGEVYLSYGVDGVGTKNSFSTRRRFE